MCIWGGGKFGNTSEGFAQKLLIALASELPSPGTPGFYSINCVLGLSPSSENPPEGDWASSGGG